MKRKPVAAPRVRTSDELPPEHTADCIEARGGPDCWPTIWELSQRAVPAGALAGALAVALVRAIDACPHRAHESYRLMYRRPAPELPGVAAGPGPAPAAAEVPA